MTERPAERRLKSLGIDSPEDIDVEAIAFHLGAIVEYEAQSGCEASITGFKNKAIIKVNPHCEPGRVRFSTAHELGHWEHHKGRQFRCRREDIGSVEAKGRLLDPEREANEYAADLLMPRYMFEPKAGQYRNLTFQAISELKESFGTSFLATAIRAIKFGPESAVLACYQGRSRSWFARSSSIPQFWRPVRELDEDSYAYDIFRGKSGTGSRRSLMDGETWFDFRHADRYEVYEESIAYGDMVLTLITGIHAEED